MTTLQDRREKGDMITTFWIMEGHERVDKSIWFETVEESRGAGFRTRQDTSGQLVQEPLGLEIKKHFFSQMIGPCSSLSESTRRSETVNTFNNSNDQWVEGRGQSNH